ncbi:MAG: hypothetical protein ACRC0A_04625 [Chitinophagaceae bacterium]
MRKILLFLTLIIGCSTPMIAQQKNAIGLRLGWDIEISYQRFFSEKNRIELDLGFPNYIFNGLLLTGTYHWIFKPSVFPKGLDWYVGPGVQIGFWKDRFNIAAVGQIGMEYNFDIPIQLSIDYRPSLGISIGDPTRFYGGWLGFGLGVRYKF